MFPVFVKKEGEAEGGGKGVEIGIFGEGNEDIFGVHNFGDEVLVELGVVSLAESGGGCLLGGSGSLVDWRRSGLRSIVIHYFNFSIRRLLAQELLEEGEVDEGADDTAEDDGEEAGDEEGNGVLFVGGRGDDGGDVVLDRLR